jgi:hypothetical protein
MARRVTPPRCFDSCPRCRPVVATPSRGSPSGVLSLTKETCTPLRSLLCRTLLPRWRPLPARQTSPTSSSQRGSRCVADGRAYPFPRISSLPTRPPWRAYPGWSLKLPPSHGRLSCCRVHSPPSQRQKALHRLLRQCLSSARRLPASSWSGCMTGRPPNKPLEPAIAAAAIAAQGQRRWAGR